MTETTLQNFSHTTNLDYQKTLLNRKEGSIMLTHEKPRLTMTMKKTLIILSIVFAYLLCWQCMPVSNAEGLETKMRDEVYYQYILKRAQMIHDIGAYNTWSIESKATLDQILVDGGWMESDNAVINAVPLQEDVSQEEVLRLALELLDNEFSFSHSDFEQWNVEYTFFRMPTEARWILQFLPKEEPHNVTYDTYRVEIESPSGEVSFFRKEQVDNRTFSEEDDTLPSSGDISEEEAIKIVTQQVFDTYSVKHRLTKEVFDDFAVYASYVSDHERGRIWFITFKHPDTAVDDFFGSFCVTISAETGEVLEITDALNG